MTDMKPSGIVRNAILLAFTLLLLWILSPFSDFFEQAGVTFSNVVASALIVLLSIVAMFSTYFLVEALFLSPARLEQEAVAAAGKEKETLLAISKRIEPRLAVELDAAGNLATIYFGSTSETYGGQRYVTYTAWEDAACLLCTNTGEDVARNCQARLTRVWHLDKEGNKEIRILESLPLGWDRKMAEGSTSTDILPNETKRLFIGSVRPNGAMGLWQKLEMQPIEYHLMFKDAGSYRLEISISIDDRSPTLVHVDIETRTVPPEPNKMGKASATLRLHDPVIMR